jgi:hypothetical protein
MYEIEELLNQKAETAGEHEKEISSLKGIIGQL